jgi:hypothetical protein
MINIKKINLLFLFAAIFCFSFGSIAFAQITPLVQTNSATSIQNSSAFLNANLTDIGGYGSSTVYFQWGTTNSYGYQTSGVIQNYIGSFSQSVSGLMSYTTYHFRAVAQNNYGTVYGQDMTFTTGQSGGSLLTANAGPDSYLTSGQTLTLQGSGYDPNGYALNYYWSCTGGTLSSYNVAQPVYTAPYAVNYNNQTTYTCTLTVTNNYGNSASDNMIVYVNYNNGGSGSNYVQTNYATYVSSSGATLNGSLQSFSYATNYVYFQWGTTTNYGSQTIQQTLGSNGTFMQVVGNLNSGTTYHFRAVAQSNYGTLYGQDMTFSTLGSNYYGSNNGYFSVNKQVMDINSGNLSWASSVNAKPSDILSFAITLQAGSQDVHNVVVHDILPANLIYKGNLIVNTNSNYGGDISSGVNIGTIYANQATVISYKVQVAPSGNFSYGATTLTNNAIITSNESGTQTGSATVIVNKSLVYGASTSDTASSVSTGLTNNFLTDSFFLPLLLLATGLWFYFSGEIYVFADKLKSKIRK